MGVFQTKVYKECYPFSREVLYNTEKRKLIIHLLEFRNPDLVYGSKKKAMITGRKLRKQVLVAVDEELDKIDEIYTYIENREYAKVDGIYMNWLLITCLAMSIGVLGIFSALMLAALYWSKEDTILKMTVTIPAWMLIAFCAFVDYI